MFQFVSSIPVLKFYKKKIIKKDHKTNSMHNVNEVIRKAVEFCLAFATVSIEDK